MPPSNKFLANLSGGEVAPEMYGRADLPLYGKSVRKMENFIALAQGGARYRPGTMFVNYTKNNNPARLIPFQFNDQQAYVIEATDQCFRFFINNSAICNHSQNITGVSQTNPATFTVNAHGYTVGQTVFISGLVGPYQLNNQFYQIASVTTNTFTVSDIFGNLISSQALSLWTSGGTVASVYELTTPYRQADLDGLQWAQSGDTMYLVHQSYEPRKMTRTGNAAWTLTTYTRTADPFVPDKATITGVTQANPCAVTCSGGIGGLQNGDLVWITGVSGMTNLNGNFYVVAGLAGTTFNLQDTNGNNIDSTGFPAWTSGGTVQDCDVWPGAAAFIDATRLVFGGSRVSPSTIWGSQAPSNGATAFDNFTTGTAATNAIQFTLAPINGKVDAIQWITNTSQFLVLGTYGGTRLLYGSAQSSPVDALNVTAKLVNSYGCSRTLPVTNGTNLFYIQRGQRLLRSMEYDLFTNWYVSRNRNLVSTHLTTTGMKRIIMQQGLLCDLLWALRNDGRTLAMTYDQTEQISGWHRHFLGGKSAVSDGTTAKVANILSMAVYTRPSSLDQLWFAVQRRVNNVTVNSVEYMSDWIDYPMQDDYYSGVTIEGQTNSNQASDLAWFQNVMWEVSKSANHLDMATVYDGTQTTGLTFTDTGGKNTAVANTVTMTAGSSVFNASMVGQEVWKSYLSDGSGGGRIKIQTVVSGTQATGIITASPDNLNAISANNWFITANTLYGLNYLNGETVQVVADGAPHPDVQVANGSITLQVQASKVFVGYKYRGLIKFLNMDSGGKTGTAEGKPRSVQQFVARFVNTVGVKLGTTLYNIKPVIFRKSTDVSDRGTVPYTGNYRQNFEDNWELLEKNVVLVQDQPQPCTVGSLDVFLRTSDNDAA